MENKIKTGYLFQKEFKVTAKQIQDFAEVSTDTNPIHLDEKYAETTRFKRPIAHGLLVASFISAVLGNDFPGQGTIYLSQSLDFKAPVYPDDIIKVSIKLLEDLGKGKYKLETICTNQNNTTVIFGQAIILNPNLHLNE